MTIKTRYIESTFLTMAVAVLLLAYMGEATQSAEPYFCGDVVEDAIATALRVPY